LSKEAAERVDRSAIAAGGCDCSEGVLLTYQVLGEHREPQPRLQHFPAGTIATQSLWWVIDRRSPLAGDRSW
jgi:hypothetical protein